MDISIIIPVYNTAKYLKRCVQSVINQEEITKEIILVDDGSTDNSPTICNSYSDQYSYITTIHIKNSGPSTAKNIGYEKASGKYVAFIDSDDKIRKNMFAKMVRSGNNNNADIVCCNYTQINELGQVSHTEYTNKEYVLDKEEGLKHLLIKDKIYSQCWTKIYKKEMLDKSNILNIEGLKTEEDFIYNIRAFTHSQIVTIVDEPLYIYTHRESSLSKDYFKLNISQYIDNRILRLNIVDSIIKESFPNLIEYSTYHCIFYYNELIGKVSLFSQFYADQRIKKVFKYIRNNSNVLKKYHDQCGFGKFGMLLVRFLPISLYLFYRKLHYKL